MKITGGAPGDGKVLTSDAAGLASWQAPSAAGGVPSGAVMSFDLDACPTGWSALTAAKGRYIVGLQDGGVRGQTVGTALTDQEDRPTGLHRHFATYYRFNNTETGGIIPNLGTVVSTPLVATFARSFQDGAVEDPPSGTNAPYIQFLVCRKD